MDLIAYAIPIFLLAILAELVYGLRVGRNTYRINDSISSLFLGLLSQTRRFVTLGVGGYVYHLITEYFSLPLLDAGHWATWVLAIVLYDFCYYWLHRLGHERTILWAAHVAHHQSEEYNLTTALRQTSTGFLLGWVFYIPMYLVGIPAEVAVTAGAINLLYQFWVHTRHLPKLGWYEWIFVTPSNHRVHHGQNDIYMDRNYGGLFILWDRLFGTFQEELDEEPVIYGIRGPLRSWNPVRALTHIYVDMALDSWHTASWLDKLRVWVGRTGWRPADVEARYPKEKGGLEHFSKYDPRVPAPVSIYGLYQLFALIGLLVFMQHYPLEYRGGFSLWALMLTTAVVTALWLEGYPGRKLLGWEVARLIFAAVLLVTGWWQAFPPVALLALVLYLVVNVVFLIQLRASGGGAQPAAVG